MKSGSSCQRCDGVLKRWSELTGEEREVVERLPSAADYTPEERRATHRWCTRCWHEAPQNDEDLV